MDTWVWIVIAVAAVAVIIVLLALWMAGRRRRTGRLREQFGPEYDRTVDETGARRKAEAELEERRERREELEIRPLAPAARERYAERWRVVQERFVDDPGGAVTDADRLVNDVMRDRGYPVDEDFERRAADISVDHPHLVENYRAANRTAAANARGEATTEELRQAVVHYRSLFDDLLGEPEAAGVDERPQYPAR
ncbi:MAG: hypothetical protein M3292_11980 [Actinomycetota bacterium]|jgi:FtsZ-interacting cell division protein ZipA|nr:hypothetical protein [Actinomycetota bacterium]